MKKEFDYFYIDGALGWNQDWFKDLIMREGGCAAVTACDLCICLAKEKGLTSLYPFDAQRLNKEDYIAFSKIMKKYLHPRWQGIDTLDLYISGFGSYLKDINASRIKLSGLLGNASWQEAKELIKRQVDKCIPVPFLLLYHKDRAFNFYQWHWFNLAGYEEFDGEFYVKAITYGHYQWLNLQELWDTGHRKKGGIICADVELK